MDQVMPFSRLPLDPTLMRAVKELGFQRPTPIQEQAIPPAVEGRDLLATATTGSGKTAAFLLPILHRLAPKPRGVTRALVLTPTRELAAQIQSHFEELAVHSPVTGAAVFVGIRQAVYPCGRELKSALLAELVARNLIDDAIVFTRTKHRANRLAQYLERRGISTGRIHGNRSQGQRTAALSEFKAGKTRILVATDIVARGIDIESLGHVVNFDVPADPDSYIHRVGRTARAEQTGDAFTLVAPDEENDLRDIERAIGRPLPRVTLPAFDYARKPEERLEIPLNDQLAPHRAQPRRHSGAHRPFP